MFQVQPRPASLLDCFKELDVSPGTLVKKDLEAHITANGGIWVSIAQLTVVMSAHDDL